MKSKGKASSAEIQKFLKGVDYPVHKKDLLSHAKNQGAPDEVISVLKALPDNEYGGPTDVAKGVGNVG